MRASKKELAAQTLAAIKAELEEAKRLGQNVDAVFITSDLRYIIAAHPNDALTHVLGRGLPGEPQRWRGSDAPLANTDGGGGV